MASKPKQEKMTTLTEAIAEIAKIEKETMSIWGETPSLFSHSDDNLDLWKAKANKTIANGVEQALHRFLDLGYRLSDLEIRTTMMDAGGLNIQVRSKVNHRKVTPLETYIHRMFVDEGVREKLLRHFATSQDLSNVSLGMCGLSMNEIKDLHAGMYSRDYLVVTCDLFHKCSDEPVAFVEVNEGEEKPRILECPGCETTIQPGTSWWGGYRYMLSSYWHDIMKDSWQNRNKREE